MSLPEFNLDQDSNDTGDLSSALADISGDLFGQGSDDADKGSLEEPQVPGTPTSVEPGAQTSSEEGKTLEEPATPPPGAETTPEVQATGAPKTWSPEAIAEWATIPPRAQQEILKREQDIFKGIEQYREKADLGTKYDTVVEPYRAQLSAENVDPVQLFQAFAGNHYLLARGTPQQKAETAARLLTGYGIPLEPVLALIAGQPTGLPEPDPKLTALEKTVEQLQQEANARQQKDLETQQAEFARQVDEFAADAKNIYFKDVINDMVPLLKTGVAKTLPQAYEMAVYQNPTTRQKELDRMTAETVAQRERDAAGRFTAAEKAKGANVKTSAKTANGTVPVGSMDETLKETLETIQSRG